MCKNQRSTLEEKEYQSDAQTTEAVNGSDRKNCGHLKDGVHSFNRLK